MRPIWRAMSRLRASTRCLGSPGRLRSTIASGGSPWVRPSRSAECRRTPRKLLASVSAGKVSVFKHDPAVELPEAFDSEANWPKCAKVIGDIRDQSACGCCWVSLIAWFTLVLIPSLPLSSFFPCATTKHTVFSDDTISHCPRLPLHYHTRMQHMQHTHSRQRSALQRLRPIVGIWSNGTVKVPLSAQETCFCASMDGCDGGDLRRLGLTSQTRVFPLVGRSTVQDLLQTSARALRLTLPHCHHHGPVGKDPYPSEGTKGCPNVGQGQSPAVPDSLRAWGQGATTTSRTPDTALSDQFRPTLTKRPSCRASCRMVPLRLHST